MKKSKYIVTYVKTAEEFIKVYTEDGIDLSHIYFEDDMDDYTRELEQEKVYEYALINNDLFLKAYTIMSGFAKEIPPMDSLDIFLSIKDNPDVLVYIADGYRNGFFGVHHDNQLAFDYYKQAAELGNPRGNYMLGTYYDDLIGDFESAIKYYKVAIELEYPQAYNKLAQIYNYRVGVEADLDKVCYYIALNPFTDVGFEFFRLAYYKHLDPNIETYNPELAIFYLEKAVSYNDIDGMLELANIYEMGKVVDENINKALYYYNLAIKFDSIVAMACLGWIYVYDERLPHDYNLACELLTKAADKDNLLALRTLGALYFESNFDKYDRAKGISYFKRAALKNDGYSLYRLGELFLYDKDLKDVDKGLDYLKKAVDVEYPRAFVTLARYYYYVAEVRDTKRALELLLKALELNASDVHYLLASIYRDIGENDKALATYKLGASINDATCMNMLGVIYEDGDIVERNYETAIKYYQEACALEEPWAAYNLGLIYAYGKLGKEVDLVKAEEYFIMGAELQHVKSCLELYYLFRKKGEEYRQVALHYLTYAANQGNGTALNELGCYYYFDIDKPDATKAIELLNQAIDVGDTSSFYDLYCIYRDLGDEEMQLKTLSRGASVKDARSLNTFGVLYENGEMVEQDIKRALEYYQEAYANGSQSGAYNLGLIYEYDKIPGIKNLKTALKYYQDAYDYGSPFACYSLYQFYYNGTEVERDTKKAIEYLNVGVIRKDPESTYRLADLYFLGDDTIKIDYELAVLYYEVAASLNYPRAFSTLGNLYDFGVAVKMDKKKAFEYYKKAALLEDVEGIASLGLCYILGEIFEDDVESSIAIFKKGIELNIDSSLVALGEIYLTLGKNNEAIALFNNALDHEYYNAAISLYKVYAYGLSGATDMQLANKYFYIAKAHEEENFKYYYALELISPIVLKTKDEDEGYKILNELAAKDDVRAINYLKSRKN